MNIAVPPNSLRPVELERVTQHLKREVALPPSLGLLAVRLLGWARDAGEAGLIHVANSERRAEQLCRVVQALAPDLAIHLFRPWDCLPYDRAPPSREAMGHRVAVLSALTQPADAPRLVVTTPDALVQRVPPRETWADATFTLRVGEPLDLGALERYLRRAGYAIDDRVDEVGEAAIRGQVVDLFPAASRSPHRIDHADGRIEAIRVYDAVTQRTVEDVRELLLTPVSELWLSEQGETEQPTGSEHWLPEYYNRLDTLFDYLPEAAFVLEDRVEARRRAVADQIADSHEGRSTLKPERDALPRKPLAPERLYLNEAEWTGRLAERAVTALVEAEESSAGAATVPRFVTGRSPERAFAAFVGGELKAGRRVAIAAALPRDLLSMTRLLERRLGRTPENAANWEAIRAATPGTLLAVTADLESGFRDQQDDITVVAASDFLGSRAGSTASTGSAGHVGLADVELRPGDAVIHIDHGIGVLEDIERITAGEVGTGDTIRLGYAADVKLMAPATEIGRIWRYGSDSDALTLDKLNGGTWPARRAKVEAELAETADGLVALARQRDTTTIDPLVPLASDYERFASRFPFSETPDQACAIEAVLQDLASGKPADRLVCGDVGFGKTEVALRAAAAAALAGKQVAIVAPTTVLVRQHLRTVERRFAGLGITVGHLSRLAKPAEAKAVKAGLADGSIRVVLGTHAVAGKGVAFKNLGLLVIDEEQRFGAADKTKLRALGTGVNVLTLTATPIPRTLQAAMVGLQDLSIIATPPARRQPIRTFLVPFDPVTVREALMRERRRGGQSFVVCPRVDDMEPLRARLAEIAPELDVLIAHGQMPPAAMDDVMVRFSEGEGDVLLATSIIESGLDVPRANTMLVWHPDRFGLAQLHQLRGRVGRGRARGICYLLSDPQEEFAESARKRLQTLEALDRLGAGFAISARDLDLRGAGDLLGDEQAGHMKLIGIGLYQHMLERALRTARGETLDDDWTPELNVGLAGEVPVDYVPEPETRITLYARLTRLAELREIDDFEGEVADRFGPLPDAMAGLIATARLRLMCRKLGIARIDAGPQAIALTFRPGAVATMPAIEEAIQASREELAWKGERLVWTRPSETERERQQLVAELLDDLAES